MNKKIFRSSFFSTLIVLIISFILTISVLSVYFEGQLFNELKNESNYISVAIKNEGVSYIDNFHVNDKRITLIAPDGTVLKDTNFAPETLDNHAHREEIESASKNGFGTSSRYSDALMKKTLYYAIKMDDGNILRVSITQNSILVLLLGLLQPLMIIIIIALLLNLIFSHRVSKSIIRPINALDLDNISENTIYDELSPLLNKIATQKRIINEQVKKAHRRREEFNLITENMSEGLLIIDSKSNILTHNQTAVKLLDSISHFSFDEVLSGKKTENNITINDCIYKILANPVFDNDKIIGAIILIIDVTETINREQLRREFTSNVSHELKTPLTSISGFAEMMKEGDTPDVLVKDFSSSIYDEAQRLITLVSDIIKISELDENSSAFERENVDLYSLSEEIIKRLTPYAKKHNVEIKLHGEHTSILGVRKILDEIIYNLCDNAIKYNKENGTVDLKLQKQEKSVIFTIKDTGIGIPLLDQNRIFERFYRVDKSHSKLVGGTGLGLSIVKHGVLFHNAKISLDSTENEGTVITIEFPC